MYIPMKSGHQKQTIHNFILGELRRYIRCSTQEFNFLKMKNKFFKRLRLRGYKKLFLKRLFRKVKHSLRILLLKFPPTNVTEKKFYSERKENEILENAEQTFQETFSDDFLNLMENVLNSDSGTNSIVSHQNINYIVNVMVIDSRHNLNSETQSKSIYCHP